jgi:2-polyprenyl-3-methyl-5-hydroxy-6-metoxy-1,4-benzoquinol methylase
MAEALMQAPSAVRHYGTIGLTDQRQLSLGYDAVADHMWMEPEFYAGMARKVAETGVDRDASLIDVGCGTGPMLGALGRAGFTNLSGVDFSARCVEKTRQAVPQADVWQHDVLDGPLPPRDTILMTEVIEHVADPIHALRNIHTSLKDGGTFIISFPNRWAYWPLYYLNPVRNLLPASWRLPRAAVDFLTIPYEMRSTQPIDHAYSVPEVRRLLHAAGWRIVREDGLVLWPMLRLPQLPWTYTLFNALEGTLGRLWPRSACYRYLFVCVKAGPTELPRR